MPSPRPPKPCSSFWANSLKFQATDSQALFAGGRDAMTDMPLLLVNSMSLCLNGHDGLFGFAERPHHLLI